MAIKHALQSLRTFMTGKARLLSILLTGALLFGLVSSAHAEPTSAFDYVTFQELNSQSKQIWTALMQRQGKRAAVESLKSSRTLPPQVRALAQQLRQFMISSQVHFEKLRQETVSKNGQNSLGIQMAPLLRHLLMNAILLDMNFIREETKPGLFSADSHRQRLIDLYARSFASADYTAYIRSRLNEGKVNPYEDLTVRVRSTALAGLFLYTSEEQEPNCQDIISMGWGLQIRQAVQDMSVGPETTQIFNGTFLGAFNDLALCAHKILTEESPYMTANDGDLLLFGEQKFSTKELNSMARNLFGE